jgi:hypothetical protein
VDSQALLDPPSGAVDSQALLDPPSVTLPDGAPITRGVGGARLDAEARGAGIPRLDAEALAALPLALARRVVRAAARQAGRPVPDAATTDRILGRPPD